MSQWQNDELTRAWLSAAAERNRMMAAATERMFALANVHEGIRVLDVGTGTGDTAVMLGHRVGAHGEVLATDVAPSMVTAATDAVKKSGLGNVQVVRMDLDAPPSDIGSFDAVVARNVLMFLEDVGAAVARLRGVLRAGGRLAAIVWAELERNPFNAIPIGAVRTRGKIPARAPEIVRAFSLSSPALVQSTFERAGLAEIAVERIASVRAFAKLGDALQVLHDIPLYREFLAPLSDAEREGAMREIEQAYAVFRLPDGAVAFPQESLVAAGAAPFPDHL